MSSLDSREWPWEKVISNVWVNVEPTIEVNGMFEATAAGYQTKQKKFQFVKEQYNMYSVYFRLI